MLIRGSDPLFAYSISGNTEARRNRSPALIYLKSLLLSIVFIGVARNACHPKIRQLVSAASVKGRQVFDRSRKVFKPPPRYHSLIFTDRRAGQFGHQADGYCKPSAVVAFSVLTFPKWQQHSLILLFFFLTHLI